MAVDFVHVFKYHAPTDEQIAKYGALRAYARAFAEKIEELVPAGADRAAAIRKVREAMMTANSGIALNGRIDKI